MNVGAPKAQAADKTTKIEYSAREVSPAPLLLQQVLTAHRIFLLHHGPTISELFVRSSRDKFCNILDRFWTRFCRNWEVLLHGNPAVDVFGGIKLAAGGELGVGVGEEEWGSGERDVLEHLVRETEGMVDMTVSRFGQVAPLEADDVAGGASKSKTWTEPAPDLPWLGGGNLPQASDGVIFGGTGAIARSSLRDVTAWVQQIYTYGDHAYGVKDNPQRMRRKRRRPQPQQKQYSSFTKNTDTPPSSTNLRKQAHERSRQRSDDDISKKPEHDLPFPLPHDPRPQIHDRVASHDHATGTASPQIASHPGIPPPIVTAAEESLEAAAKAAGASKPGASVDKQDGASMFGVSDKWMKYLTLGLSTYSQSPRSRSSSPTKKRPSAPRRTSSSSSKTIRASSKASLQRSKEPDIPEQDEEGPMQTLDPAPDGHELSAQLAKRKYQERHGHFLIGYTGDLDIVPVDKGEMDEDPDSGSEDGGERKMIRTLQVKLKPKQNQRLHEEELYPSHHPVSDPESDSAATEDNRRLRVLVYVHRPFIFTFLFDTRTDALKLSSFYSKIHTFLQPLYRPLLRSTSLEQVAQRIADAHTSPPSSVNTENGPFAPPRSSPVFDLVSDPLSLTIHTSIPNIPDPGTPAAEGLATTSTGRSDPPLWTRLEAINVHSQILNTLAATATQPLGSGEETERTSKTSRGWWVVWMRIPPTPTASSAPNSSSAEEAEGPIGRGRTKIEDCRVAFLVRKASDGMGLKAKNTGGGGSGYSSRVASGMGGMFGFGSSAHAAVAEHREDSAAAGVGWGLGIDARKYVEGLLSLNR